MTAPKVLVVEDDFLLSFEIETILADAGYEVVGPAATVAKALNLIDGNQLDAAFVDCNLNGEFATAVAITLAAKGIPFAVVTGYQRERLPDAFNYGLFASKPFNAAGLLEIARTLLKNCSGPVPFRTS